MFRFYIGKVYILVGLFKINGVNKYVCKNNGGSGAFRELADLILSFQI